MSATEPVEWVARTREDAVDPRRRIVDAHHHLWSDGEGFAASPRYHVEDLLGDNGAVHNVTETVFIECDAGYRTDGPEALRPVGETEFAAAQAERSERTGTRLAAIVGFADLTLGDAVDEVLDAHEAAGGGRFRGVRHITAADPAITLGSHPSPPGLLGTADFRRGLERLGRRGLSYDAWVVHPQLPELADAARAAHATTVVVDHLGGPLNMAPYLDRDEVRSVWQRGMRELAACPNVVVKLGGIGMDRLFGMGWSSRERPPGSDEVVDWWGDQIRWCIDTFGPSRCMFESNYPVDRRGVGYTVLWNAFQKIGAAYTDDEQDALCSTTAARVYRIDLASAKP